MSTTLATSKMTWPNTTYGRIGGYIVYSTSSTDSTFTISVGNMGEVYTSTGSGSSTYSISIAATIAYTGLGSSYNKSVSISGSRSATMSSSSSAIYSSKGTGNSRTYTKTTSAQTVTLTVTYTLSGYSSLTTSKEITIPALTKYTVTYNKNGGTAGSVTSQTGYYGKSITISSSASCTRTGYTFLGWSTSSSATSATYTAGSSYTVTKNVTLYAVWSPNVYTITLNNQSATSAGTTAYYEKYNTGNYTTSSCSTTISTITKPTKTGYTFGGYYTSTGGSGTQYINASGTISSTSTTFTSNTTLYAKWTANTYTLTVDPQGGTYNSTTSTSTKTMTYNATTNNSIGVPTRTNYTFNGWYTGTSGSGTQIFTNTGAYNSSATSYWSSGAWIYTGALTVYASWTLNYDAPTITSVTTKRADSTGTADDEGTYLNISFTPTCDSNLTIDTVVIKYMEVGGSSYTTLSTISAPTSGTALSYTGLGSGAFATSTSYIIAITITDSNSQTKTITDTLTQAFFTMDYGSEGYTIGMGMAAADLATPSASNARFDLGIDMYVTSNGTTTAAITDGMLEDEMVMSSSTISAWATILGITL